MDRADSLVETNLGLVSPHSCSIIKNSGKKSWRNRNSGLLFCAIFSHSFEASCEKKSNYFKPYSQIFLTDSSSRLVLNPKVTFRSFFWPDVLSSVLCYYYWPFFWSSSYVCLSHPRIFVSKMLKLKMMKITKTKNVLIWSWKKTFLSKLRPKFAFMVGLGLILLV